MTSSTSVANHFLEEGDKDVNTKKGKSTICTKKNHPSPDDTDFCDEEENEFESILTSNIEGKNDRTTTSRKISNTNWKHACILSAVIYSLVTFLFIVPSSGTIWTRDVAQNHGYTRSNIIYGHLHIVVEVL